MFVDSRQVASPGTVLQWTLPTQPISFPSGTFEAVVKTTPAPAVPAGTDPVTEAVAAKYCVLNPLRTAILDGVMTETTGGVTVDPGCIRQYNVAHGLHERLTYNMGANASTLLYERTVRTAEPTAGDNEPGTKIQIKLANLPGTFIGSLAPSTFDCALAPLKITLRLAPGSTTFISNDADAVNTAEYSQIALMFDTVTIADHGLYDQALAQTLNKGEVLQVPFRRWQIYQQGPRSVNGALNVALNSSCVKSVTSAFLRPLGTGELAYQYDPVSKTSKGHRWSLDTSAAIDEALDVALDTSFTQIGAQVFPSWQPSLSQIVDQTLRNFLVNSKRETIDPAIVDEKAYLRLAGGAHKITFGLEETPQFKLLRIRDGLNLLGAEATASFTTAGVDDDDVPTKIVIVESIPLMLIGAGRQVQMQF
jgi:hypothetical protein